VSLRLSKKTEVLAIISIKRCRCTSATIDLSYDRFA